jgi:hypothetical protein
MIEQAIYGSQDGGGYRFLARSPGFRDDWLSDAERLCTGFGERPAGVTCPESVFALPLGAGRNGPVAVVQVADQGLDDAGRPGALGFRLLIVSRGLYANLGGDPFLIAEQFPPAWQARGELPTLSWEAGPPPPRTVDDLRRVLDVPNSATLLGGVQALLDGGRLVFERSQPDTALLRSLWALLPTASRSELWPASFAFSNAHHFHAVVVPRASGPDFAHSLDEVQTGDYPEGRYELALQTAVESGNQQDVNGLLARRTRGQTFRLALALLVAFLLVALGSAWLAPPPRPARSSPTTAARPAARLDLIPTEECRPPPPDERQKLARRLAQLGRELGVEVPAGTSDADLTEALARIDGRLGTPHPGRNPGRLADLGPPQRQLRALLWKHGGADYNEHGLNTLELLDRLEARLAEERKPKEPARE